MFRMQGKLPTTPRLKDAETPKSVLDNEPPRHEPEEADSAAPTGWLWAFIAHGIIEPFLLIGIVILLLWLTFR